MQRTNAAVWVGASFDACALWRFYFPHFSYPGSSFWLFTQKPDLDQLSQADVCLVQRCCSREQMEFLSLMRQLGVKLIYDLDDNMWEVPTFNPMHKVLEYYKQGFLACMTSVDVITVSTNRLATVVRNQMKPYLRQLGKHIPVVVAENRIEPRAFSPPSKAQGLIVGWAGSSSHIGDLLIAEQGLIQVATEYPNVTFEFRGMAPANMPLPNVRFRLWSMVAEYAARMPQWGWSIALAPLTDDVFNNSKSCIKMVEAAYCSIPCLASWVEPYAYFCSFDKDLQWLLCASSKDWAPKLRDLINDEGLRSHLGKVMNKVMHEHFSLAVPHEGWNRAFATARG